MLKAAPIAAPNGHQVALPEIDVCSNLPSAAAALNFEVVVPQSNAVSRQLQPQASLEQRQPTEEAEEPVVMEEYNLFTDYLGLYNLVKSLVNVPDDFMGPSNADEYNCAVEEGVRERRDSLGSAGSEFSSSNSAESVEVADIYYNAAYGPGPGLAMKQAFLDSGEESSKESTTPTTTTTIIPTSLLLDHKIMAAKKPQVSHCICFVYSY